MRSVRVRCLPCLPAVAPADAAGSTFRASDPHSLRTSVSSFFDFASLVIRTLETFGAPG